MRVNSGRVRVIALLATVAAYGPAQAAPCVPIDFGRHAIGEALAGACGSRPSCDIEDAAGIDTTIVENLVREKRIPLSRLPGFASPKTGIDEDFARAASRAACVSFRIERQEDDGDTYLTTAEQPDPTTGYPFVVMIYRDPDSRVWTLSRTSLPSI